MTLLLQHATPVALWHHVIHEAESDCSIFLKEDLESYLVFLLMRYIDKPEIVKHIMAVQFLKATHLPFQQRQKILQEVGDQCLLFSGLFPCIAKKRFVKISYFVKLGQTAYHAISDELYQHLAEQFVGLMDILQSLRNANTRPVLLPLDAYELWDDTQSQRAFASLRNYTDAFPVFHVGCQDKN